MLNALAKNIPWLIGGSADLAPSTKTRLTFEGAGDFSAENYAGRNFHFGIREHAMGAVLNGMSLVKVRPFGSGFFIFVDYMRGAPRLSALIELPVFAFLLTIPLASARTVQLTSQSKSLHICARCLDLS